VKKAHLVLSQCCKNLVAIGHTKNALPSQWLILDREENGFLSNIFEHDQGMFFEDLVEIWSKGFSEIN
jgi:hypothetical protein